MNLQLTEHLLSNKWHESLHSGFCSPHSTETALTKVVEDFQLASDTGSVPAINLVQRIYLCVSLTS